MAAIIKDAFAYCKRTERIGAATPLVATAAAPSTMPHADSSAMSCSPTSSGGSSSSRGATAADGTAPPPQPQPQPPRGFVRVPSSQPLSFACHARHMLTKWAAAGPAGAEGYALSAEADATTTTTTTAGQGVVHRCDYPGCRAPVDMQAGWWRCVDCDFDLCGEHSRPYEDFLLAHPVTLDARWKAANAGKKRRGFLESGDGDGAVGERVERWGPCGFYLDYGCLDETQCEELHKMLPAKRGEAFLFHHADCINPPSLNPLYPLSDVEVLRLRLMHQETAVRQMERRLASHKRKAVVLACAVEAHQHRAIASGGPPASSYSTTALRALSAVQRAAAAASSTAIWPGDCKRGATARDGDGGGGRPPAGAFDFDTADLQPSGLLELTLAECETLAVVPADSYVPREGMR